ncbi:MAG: tetratricopeptide repeat protein, partial [Limisphaerales bacterium]
VAWASERKDVLSAFFWMLTLLCYARYGRDIAPRCPPRAPGGGTESASTTTPDAARTAVAAPLAKSPAPTLFYCLSLFFFACGLMSKPMVVTLPFVLLLLDFWPLQRIQISGTRFQPLQFTGKMRGPPGLFIEKIPFFALMAAACVVTLSVQKNAMWSTGALPFSFRFANTLMAYVRYLSKIFVPKDLALIYPYPHSWPLLCIVAAGAALLLLTFIFLVNFKRFPYLPMGWFWFLGTLVPVIGLVQVGVQSMADRYTYLPSIGIFVLIVWGICDLLAASPRKFETCAFAGGLALIACFVLTSIQLGYWRDSVTIFTHTVEVTTDNYAAYDCLGKSWQNKGRLDHAEQCYQEAVQLEPDYPLAQFDLGMSLVALRDPTDASNHLATAVRLWPSNADIQYDFGVFLSRHGQLSDSVAHLKTALAIQPDFPEARRELNAVEAPEH